MSAVASVNILLPERTVTIGVLSRRAASHYDARLAAGFGGTCRHPTTHGGRHAEDCQSRPAADRLGRRQGIDDRQARGGGTRRRRRGCRGHLLSGAVLRAVLLPGAGHQVLRLHRADPRRPDHAALPVRRQGARHGDGPADVRDRPGRRVLQHRRRDRRRRQLPRQVPQAAHSRRSRGSGRSSTSALATAATRSSTRPSARSACTSATTATSPRAGGSSASTAPRSCSTRRPRTAGCPSTSGGSSSRRRRSPTCITSGRSTASASRPTSATTTSTGRATSSIRRASSSATSAIRTSPS